MEWFGISMYGVSDPIKDMLRPDYKEPENPPNLLKIVKEDSTRKLSEIVNEFDIYLGNVDGYPYRSYDRMIRMQRKKLFKPVGPLEMYKYAGTTSMNFGFFNSDLTLEGESWYKSRERCPRGTTDVTKFYDEALKIDKWFRM